MLGAAVVLLAFLALTPVNILGGPAVAAVLAAGVLVAVFAAYAAATSGAGGPASLALCGLVLALLPGGLTLVFVMTSKG